MLYYFVFKVFSCFFGFSVLFLFLQLMLIGHPGTKINEKKLRKAKKKIPCFFKTTPSMNNCFEDRLFPLFVRTFCCLKKKLFLKLFFDHGGQGSVKKKLFRLRIFFLLLVYLKRAYNQDTKARIHSAQVSAQESGQGSGQGTRGKGQGNGQGTRERASERAHNQCFYSIQTTWRGE